MLDFMDELDSYFVMKGLTDSIDFTLIEEENDYLVRMNDSIVFYIQRNDAIISIFAYEDCLDKMLKQYHDSFITVSTMQEVTKVLDDCI